MWHSKVPILLLTISAIAMIDSANGLRVLGLFPHPGNSHFDFFRPILRGLAETGHSITVISHFPEKHPPKNYKDKPLSGLDVLTNTVNLSWFANRPSYTSYLEFFKLAQWGQQACEVALNSTAIKNVLNTKQKFDVILMEQFNSDCMMGVAWKLQAPVIGLSSCTLMPWHFNRIGNPHIPAYIPSLFVGYSDKMTYLERLSNWLAVHGIIFLYDHFVIKENDALLRQHFKDDNMPYLGDLVKETNLMFVNTHYSLSGPKPTSPALIELGGIHIQEPRPLDEDLKDILDSAKHGVIYVSWGSMIRAESLPDEKRNSLLEAFGSLKQKVLWKWENTTLANQPANVFIRKWMPQREILCHPNVQVFLTHGGLLGSSEAAYCGVSTVVTPMYGDQFLNAAAIKDRGMGSIVSYENITTKTIKDAIQFALDPATQENAKKVSYSFRNRPQKPLDTAIWWVEHVAATKGESLIKSHSTYLPTYIYYSLDVYATILAALLVIILSWVYLLRKCAGKLSTAKVKVQ